MSILDPALAQKFIDKTADLFEYNINIMNDKGIIIASKDVTRIGSFHEVAYRMCNGTLGTGVVNSDDNYLGTKNGVNLFIDYQNKPQGIVGVSGDPKTVNVFAGLMKTFIETMLEYELQMLRESALKDKTEQLIYNLLFDEKGDISIVNEIGEELGIQRDLTRVCMIIKYENYESTQKVIEALVNAEGYSNQDIITKSRNDDIIMFKALDVNMKKSDAIRDFRYIIDEYIKSFYHKLNIKEDYKISIIIGSMQNDFKNYRGSYLQAQELALHTKGKRGIHFLNDHIVDYYRRVVSLQIYDNVFNCYNALFSKEEKKQIAETVECLKMNNYNIVNSAKALYIHRNTLLFRLNKLKDMLNIDPISNAANREFLNELAYYFKIKR